MQLFIEHLVTKNKTTYLILFALLKVLQYTLQPFLRKVIEKMSWRHVMLQDEISLPKIGLNGI